MNTFFDRLLRRLHREQSPPDLPSQNLKAGALYSVFNGDESGTFGVVKVLVLEPAVVHIRVYQNTFPTRPGHADPATLSLGGLSLEDLQDEEKLDEKLETHRFGIGHMPLAIRDFVYGWQPVFLEESPVTEEELEGYEYWKREGGGVFGGL
jgi:hypothetical protein